MSQRILGAALLAASAPVQLAVAAVVRVCDGNPVLFRQKRLGRHQVPFEILKFRTMQDGQVTRLGRVLRATGLDELPQLVNIARGDMRFIGPRPLTVADVERLGWAGEQHRSRWDVSPGVTGYAQFAPVCDRELSWQMDDHYARYRSVALDTKIAAATAASVVVGRVRVKAWMFS